MIFSVGSLLCSGFQGCICVSVLGFSSLGGVFMIQVTTGMAHSDSIHLLKYFGAQLSQGKDNIGREIKTSRTRDKTWTPIKYHKHSSYLY